MLDNILFILGIKAYNVSFPFLSKIDIFRDENIEFPREKFKLMYNLNLVEHLEPKDEFEIGIKYKINKELNKSQILFYIIYTFYFIIVNVLLWTQCIYNFKMWLTASDTRHLVSFLTHVNVPLIHLWSKKYYRCNHMEKILNCEKFKTIIIFVCTIFSVMSNFIDIPAFHNEYMWPTLITDNDYVFFTIILIDWFFSRLLCFLFLFTVIFILKEHVSEINDLINVLCLPQEYFLENPCINNLIMDISKTKNKISKTIHLLNPIISFSTLIGAANLSLFIRNVLPENDINLITFNNTATFNNFIPFDRYLFVCAVIYTFIQSALLFYIYTYANKRESILDHIKSYSFIKTFLYRIPINSLISDDINVINASTTFDIANSVEWLILCDILSNRWIDFTIFGISTSDGKLLLKGITLGGSILFTIAFIAK
jgi:hypothetical protein